MNHRVDLSLYLNAIYLNSFNQQVVLYAKYLIEQNIPNGHVTKVMIIPVWYFSRDTWKCTEAKR